jgi:copper chaperone CopZ
MKKITLIAIVILLGACSSEPEKIYLRTEKGPHQVVTYVKANSMLTMDIQGMTCEMGCGGSIRKELKGTGSVARVRYDFVEGEETQKAYISFDSNKITAEKMIDIVEKMNDQQFSVGKYSVEKLDEETDNITTKSAPDDSEASLEMDESGFHMPNLINLLKDLVVH